MVVRVGELPPEPLEAAAQFYGEVLERVEAELENPPRAGEDLILVFPPADHTHRTWRLSAVQELARKYAPLRINAVVSDDEPAIAAAERYLANAPGVTGQLLALDGHGGG